MSATGIPIEALFGALGVLVIVIYGDMKRELRALRRASDKRDRASIKNDFRMQNISAVLGLVCKKLSVPFTHLLDIQDDNNES